MKNQIIKDAFWQVLGRVVSALGGFVTIRMMTPFLGPLRYGDYNTILKYFAIWSALADLGLYTIALRELGRLKSDITKDGVEITEENKEKLSNYYSKFMGSRIINLCIVYLIAILVAYLIPSYTSNPYIIRWLPLGMIFSATFVLGYFFQLPHQLFRSMQHTSISLVIARVGQIALLSLLLFIFPGTQLDTPTVQNIIIFCLILCTVVASGLLQIGYQWRTGRRYLSLSLDLDMSFFFKHIKDNRKYGIGYFMSSFHTLAVGILLSLFYPTSAGYYFVWVWWLSMTLVEILLIVPSSLGNSALHKVAHQSTLEKRYSFGNLMIFIWIIGLLIALNFYRFSPTIIELVSGTKYLSATLGWIGSDYILWFLWIVLLLTFTKQVFNYIFIATDHQNELFKVNTWWVVLGIGCATWLVYRYWLVWGIAGQLLVETLYALGGLRIAYRKKVLPSLEVGVLVHVFVWAILAWAGGYLLNYFGLLRGSLLENICIIWLYNVILFAILYLPTKKVLRGIG